jgi:hypothetical protein
MQFFAKKCTLTVLQGFCQIRTAQGHPTFTAIALTGSRTWPVGILQRPSFTKQWWSEQGHHHTSLFLSADPNAARINFQRIRTPPDIMH